MKKIHLLIGLGISGISIPVTATDGPATKPTYIECDDGMSNPTRLVLALDESANTVGVVEYNDYTIREVSAVSFGPDKVTFTIRRDTGLIQKFIVSRIDAGVTSITPLLNNSRWEFKGCTIIEAPAERAF